MTSDVMEVNVNMVVGAVINTAITYYLFDITPQFALVSTGIFFIASVELRAKEIVEDREEPKWYYFLAGLVVGSVIGGAVVALLL
mgnify:CR=1 FL=1